ncbi:unnamed protein product [Cochlearia groenlandica]
MPSRPVPSPSPANQPSSSHREKSTVISSPLIAAGVGFSLFITLSFCFCRFSRRKRRFPSAVVSSSSPPLKPPLREFSYSSLRKATASFSPENKLGQGGFGSVFRGNLPPPSSSSVAVKVMDSGSLQGEREFDNEIFFAGKLLDSLHVVSVIGFSRDGKRKRRRLILVYELMENGNLQDALLHRKSHELADWNRRFLVAIDVAKGIEHLHGSNPPVIHGDLKPSNVLLDRFFTAKISDFGLARLRSDQVVITVAAKESDEEAKLGKNGSVVVEDVESSTSVYDESNFGLIDQSPVVASPETVDIPTTSPETTVTTSVSVSPEIAKKGGVLEENKDWWWKQEGNVVGGGVKVKDYVMQWIGSEVKKERPSSSDWVAETTAEAASLSSKKLEMKKSKKLEWWLSLDEDKEKKKKRKKGRMVREWWKDEYRKELAKRMKKKTQKKNTSESEFYSDDMSVDEESYKRRRRGDSSSNKSVSSSIDWWLDHGLSGEQWRARRKNSHDSVKSYGVSSTPSMRGTMCYVAPECSGDNIENVSEKCDVYSYGVLLLVLVSGRRPLEVTGPASEIIQRANLMSWARKLARRGRLGDLVDEKLRYLDKEQAVLSIKVALRCLQRSPVTRPSMKEVLGMLSGEMSSPELPMEFSPSPQSQNPFKTRRKQRR